MKETFYAPVIIPTLNRYEHFKECIESLQANSWARYTDLFIALDYPPEEKYFEGYQKISKYLESGINGFANVTIVKREKNYGVKSNARLLRQEIFKKYDRVIFSEDDNVFSPCFIEYMDKTLEYYKMDPTVMGVSGFSYPIEWKNDGSNIVSSPCFYSAWGTGVWANKEKELKENLNVQFIRNLFKDEEGVRTLKLKSEKNYCYLIRELLKSNFWIMDITRSIYMIVENKRCIMPKKSLVRNCGQDGSGSSGLAEAGWHQDYSKIEIDANQSFDLIHPELAINNDENAKAENELFSAPKSFLKWASSWEKGIRFVTPDLFFLVFDIVCKLYEYGKALRTRCHERNK